MVLLLRLVGLVIRLTWLLWTIGGGFAAIMVPVFLYLPAAIDDWLALTVVVMFVLFILGSKLLSRATKAYSRWFTGWREANVVAGA